MLGLLELLVGDHRLRPRRYADWDLISARNVGARLDVVMGVRFQIVGVEILGHAQGLKWVPLLVCEQRNAGVRIGALKERHDLFPVVWVGGRFVDVADHIN